jgi:AcrR family transcriptional regulator
MTEPHAAPTADAGGVRERILNAALHILREEGIAELTQVQVSRRAGVRQSHLTYYFPRRADLLEAVGTRFVEGMEHGVRQMAAHGGDPAELLRVLAEHIAEPWHMRMFVGVVVEADREPALREVIIRHTRRLEELLAGAAGGADGMDRARLLVASLWGLGFYRFAMGEPAGSASSLLDPWMDRP